MSEPQKRTGDPSTFSSNVKGDKAEDFEGQFAEPADQEVVEEVVAEEAATEEVQAEEAVEADDPQEAVEGETDADKMVRQTTARLKQQAQEQVAPVPSPEVAYQQGQNAALKEQIRQMGQAQEVSEPEGGFDFAVLESPEVQAALQAARDSEDPTAEARAQAVIAQHVLKAERGQEVEALKQELDATKQAIQQQAQMQQNQQMFVTGLESARSLGEVEGALVKEFEDTQELAHWNAHFAQHGPTLEGYEPKSMLGMYLAANPGFAATPTFMQAGVTLLAKELTGSVASEAAAVSTTGAGVEAGASTISKEITANDGEATVEEQILGGILEQADKRRKGKAKAFQRR